MPGFNRIAEFSFSDHSTIAREINAQIAIHSVDPRAVGIRRMLVGWGWDNYIYAWESHYVPRLYAYDASRFDRPHNKLLDMLSMTGVLGLLAYVAVWIFFIQRILKTGKSDRIEGAALLLWAVAFFVQNLTAFDTLVTFVSFFAMLAYVACGGTQSGASLTGTFNDKAFSGKASSLNSYVLPAGMAVIAATAGWAFFACTFVPFLQMSDYRTGIEESWSAQSTSLLPASIFTPDTYAQGTIRSDLINTLFKAYNSGRIQTPTPFMDLGILEMEDYLSRHPYLYDDQMVLAKAYDVQSALHNDPAYLKTAEKHYLAALALIPGRQTVIYPYAINLAQQHRTPEAVSMLQELIRKNPEILQTHYILAEVYALDESKYSNEALEQFELSLDAGINLNPPLTMQAYKNFLVDFKAKNDVTRFVVAANRLSKLSPDLAGMLAGLSAKAEATHSVPALPENAQ